MKSMENGSRQQRDGVMVTHLRSNDGASAMVADHGAHLLSWCPAGADEALFMSSKSAYGDSAAIRGGVPIIFPQFGALGNGRRHGFARNVSWHYIGAGIEDGAAVASWVLASPDLDAGGGVGDAIEAHALPGFRLTFDLRLAGATIDIGLTIANASQQTWRCQAALHTYLRVDALESVRITGLEAAPYFDQTQPASAGVAIAGAATQRDATALVFAGEVDRIYPQAPSRVLLQDAQRRLEVRMQNFPDVVVWNPGQARAGALVDLHADGYRQFVCIEAAAIIAPIELASGAQWRGVQSLHQIADW